MYVTKQKLDIKTVAGLLPVQKMKVEDSNEEPIEMLAMLDTGPTLLKYPDMLMTWKITTAL